MNGLHAQQGAAAGLRPGNERLWGGLALSCLLHALVVALPLLGERTAGAAWPASAAGSASLAVTLTAASRPAAPPAGTAAADAQPLPVPAPLAVGADEPVAPPANGADLVPVAAPAYYPAAQLSKRPQPAAIPELDAPELMAIVASGKLVVVLWIDDGGKVTRAEVERTDLPEAFARAALAAFLRARFLPGERDGRQVASIMRIEASYDDHRAAHH